MKKNEKIFIGVLVIITIIAIFMLVKGKNKNEIDNKELDKNTTINLEDEYYANKNIYEKDGDVIIEEENGSKTIITNKTENKTDLKEVSEDEKQNYKLTDVKVELTGNMTKVTGKIKNNTKSTHKISIQTKFYKQDGKLAGTISTVLDSVKSGETKEFKSTIMGDYTSYKSVTEVEFTN